jgi:DNA repair exonuclease SbcCD nuclease subunit
MKKFAAMGDLHIKDWKDNENTQLGISKKLHEIFLCFKQMCDYCIKNKIEHVVVPGDINDTKNIINSKAFSFFKIILESYHDLTFHIIPGNHDITSQSKSKKDNNILYEDIFITAVDILSGPKNINVITKPTKIHNIEFIPYSSNIADDILNSKGCDILVSHFSLTSCKLSNGMLLDNGEFSKEDLNKWKLIILGDIHAPQTIGNIWYTGSPIPLTRAESGEEKRFLVVDTKTLDVTSVPTTGYRKYITIELKDGEDKDNSEICKIIQEHKDNGDFVVVKNFMKEVPEELKETVEENIFIDLYEGDTHIRGITSAMDLNSQLLKYLELMNIPEYDREKFIKVAQTVTNKT